MAKKYKQCEIYKRMYDVYGEECFRFDLIWFYGISTIVDYLMPNLIYTYILDIYMICKHKSTKLNNSKYCYVSLKIQLNVSYLFTHS